MTDVSEDQTLEHRWESTALGLVESIFAIEEAFDIEVPFNANEPEKSEFDISSVTVNHQSGRRTGERSARMKRVVITGAGTINALGHSVADTMEAMREGRCGIGDLEIRDVDRLSVKIGGQVTGYDEHAHFNRQQIALYDRFTQFTLLAADQAISQAGLTFDGQLAAESGVILGTSGGGLNTQDENYRVVYEEGKNRVHPFVVPKLMNNAAASHVSMQYNLKGPSFTVATACASSNHAMGQAFHMIRSGMSRAMVTGGSESMLCFGGVKAWEGLRVMSKDACRPFSANRNGMVQGEGAGVFVFEEYEHATGARRGYPGRGDRLCDDLGRRRYRDAQQTGGGARDHGGDARRADRPRKGRLYQCPRHRHGRQ